MFGFFRNGNVEPWSLTFLLFSFVAAPTTTASTLRHDGYTNEISNQIDPFIHQPADVKIRMRGTTAIVQCREEVTTADDVSTPWMARIKSEIASRAKLVGGAEDSLGGVAGTGGEAGGGTKKKKKKPRFLNVTNIYRKAGGRYVWGGREGRFFSRLNGITSLSGQLNTVDLLEGSASE